MTLSLDGYVRDANGSVEQHYPDLDLRRQSRLLHEIKRAPHV